MQVTTEQGFGSVGLDTQQKVRCLLPTFRSAPAQKMLGTELRTTTQRVVRSSLTMLIASQSSRSSCLPAGERVRALTSKSAVHRGASWRAYILQSFFWQKSKDHAAFTGQQTGPMPLLIMAGEAHQWRSSLYASSASSGKFLHFPCRVAPMSSASSHCCRRGEHFLGRMRNPALQVLLALWT